MRPDGRNNDELRPINFQRGFTEQTPGSVLVSFGRTKVLCTVSIDDTTVVDSGRLVESVLS